MVEAGKRQLGEVRKIAVPGVRGGRQLGFGRAVLAQFRIGDAGKVVGFGALGQPTVFAGHGHKLAIGLFGTVG